MYRTCSHGRVMCQGADQHRAHLLSPSEGEVSLCNSHKLPFRVRVRHWMPRCRPTVFLRNNYRKDYTWKLLLVKTDKSNKSRVVLRAHGTHLWMSTRHRGIVHVTQCVPLVWGLSRVMKYQRHPVGEQDGKKENKTNWKRGKTFHHSTLQGLISSNKVCILAHKIREVLTSQEGTWERSEW